MNSLSLDFNWQDGEGVKGPELRATWADLKITVAGDVITTCIDYKVRSVRDMLTLPLYPLAEWIATHWWFLVYELAAPGRGSQSTYDQRHSLAQARDGYSLPGLRISPLGDRTNLEWEAIDLPSYRVRFVKQGSARLPSTEVQEALRQFVGAVIGRLDECGVENTLLAQEWEAIEDTGQDETAFCAAAAELGLDPYATDDEQRAAILNAAERLPEAIIDDFMSVASPDVLRQQTTQLVNHLQAIASREDDLSPLMALREDLRKETSEISYASPWEQGYDFARSIRRVLGDDKRVFHSLADIAHTLGCSASQLDRSILSGDQGETIDGLTALNAVGSPGFVVTKHNDLSKRYTFCRALYEYLRQPLEVPSIVSTVRSERQQRNRAFAAEFLAPAESIQEAIRGSAISEDDVTEIARQFSVSDYVIRHQVINHQLASIITS